MQRRSFPAQRDPRHQSFVTLVSGALCAVVGVMFWGLGDVAPALAQGAVALTGLWFLLLAFDWLRPGILLPRANAVTVGVDGVQAPGRFVSWAEIESFRRETAPPSPAQQGRQAEENKRARRERRAARVVGRRADQVRIQLEQGPPLVVRAHQTRALMACLEAGFADHGARRHDPLGSGHYREATDANPMATALDRTEPMDERAHAYTRLSQGAQLRLRNGLAEKAMRALIEKL